MTATIQANKRLIAERTNRGLSQRRFAEIIGISQSFLAQLESGTRSPSFQLAKKIAQITNVEMGILFPQYQ